MTPTPRASRSRIARGVALLALAAACAACGGEGVSTTAQDTPTAASASASAASSLSAVPHPPRADDDGTPAPDHGGLDDPVPAAAPTAVSVPSVGIAAPVVPIASEHTADGQWQINPPGGTQEDLDTAYWWSEPGYSAEPANPPTGASFIYAHACEGLTCAFDSLHEAAPGETIDVATDEGTLTYRITEPPLDLRKSADGIGSSTEVYDYDAPGRLVLITCGYLPDGSSTFNWAVLADLVSAAPA